MKPESQNYLWSDAWLLTAIYGANLADEPASLARVIGTGDFINHAIFTLAELNGGFSRLEKGGLITVHDQTYSLTETGRNVTEIDPKAKKGAFYHMDTVRMRLGASEWGPRVNPNEAGDPSNPRTYVTEETFQTAFQEYRQMLKRRPKTKKKANKASEVTARKLAEPQG